MLVLSRKCGERVVVSLNGEAVTIEIVNIKGAQVRVGIEAPRHVAVHREEIWDRIVSEQLHRPIMPVAG